jgi:hypothetical protein
MRIIRRRPSPAMVVALIALFVALGGPAQARKLLDGNLLRTGSVTGRAIKDHSVGKVDLTTAAVKSLTATPARSVGSSQLRDGQVLAPDLGIGAVGASQLAPGAVSASKLAPNSVGGSSVANGSLQTTDIGSFAGSLRPVPDFVFTRSEPCQVRQGGAIPAGSQPNPNIGDDVVAVTPPADWPDTVVVTGKPAPNNQIRVVACWIPRAADGQSLTLGPTVINYVTFDSP